MILNKIKDKIPKKEVGFKYLVALDIGTENVKALVAKIKGTKLEIIGVGRAHQDLADMESGAIADIAGVVDNCDKALNEAESMAGVDARNVVIGIAGELVRGATATIKVKRQDAKKEINMEEMQRIISLVQSRAKDNASKSLKLELGKEVDVRLVNSALVSINIDGYNVTNPIGFQGQEMAIQIYTAYAPMLHIGALERVAKELDLDLVAVAAEPFAVARSVIGDDSNSNLSAVLLDVGGGTTDLAVVNDGGVEGTQMFGIGGRAFTRTIANDQNIEFSVAEKKKLELSHAKGSKKDNVTDKSISKTLDVWMSGVELALDEFDNLDHLPNKLLLCGGGASLPALLTSLEQQDWYKALPFTQQPTIHLIDPEQVVGIVDKTDTIHDHTYITAMGLLRVGLDTVAGDDDESDGIRDRLNKLLSI